MRNIKNKKKKKIFVPPTTEIIKFKNDDVIVTSGDELDPEGKDI